MPRAASKAVEAGLALDEAIAQAGFLESLTCFVYWGQTKNALADAFAAAAEAFEARTTSQAALLNMIVLPLAYLFIITFIGYSFLALLLPFMNLLISLSGGMAGSPTKRLPPRWRMSDNTAFIVGSNLAQYAIGVLLLMVTRWISGPAPGDRRTILRACVRVFGWMVVIVGFAAGNLGNLLAPTAGVIDMLFYGLGTIWIVSLAAIIAMAYGKQAGTQQYAMLALLGAATERAMPLEGVFAAFGHERGGWMQRRARKISHLLLEGVPLPAALEKVPGVLPPEAVPLVRVGYDTGTLPSAIRQAIAARNFFEPAWQAIVPKVLYVCVLPGMAASIVATIVLKITPIYKNIFRDFGIDLPRLTRSVIANSETSTFLFGLLGAVWLVTTLLAAYVVLRYAGSIHWDLPGTGWLMRQRHTATLLDGLALAAEQQKPFANAVMQIAIGHSAAEDCQAPLECLRPDAGRRERP